MPGYQAEALDGEGKALGVGETGALVVKSPLPPGLFRTLWNADERFVGTYFRNKPGYYETGDAGYIDENR